LGIADRKIREKAKRIQQIQSAARAIFSKKGYFATTMDSIANRAEVSKSAIYYHFKSKDELYVSLMIPMVEQILILLTEFEKRMLDNIYQDAEGFLNAFFDMYLRLQEYDSEGLKIYQNFQLNSLYSILSKNTQKHLKELGKKNYETQRKIISKANDLGLLSNATPIQLGDVIWGLFLGLTQVEKSKLQLSRKDFLTDTLKYAAKVLSQGLSSDGLTPRRNLSFKKPEL